MRLSASRGAPSKRVTRTSRHRQSVQPIAEQLPLCRRQDASCLAEQCLQRDGVYRGPFSRRCRVGSSVWGVGAGRNGEGGEYRVAPGLGSPVNADAPDVTVEFVDVSDDVVNPLGVNPLGVGEIGQVGVAAAIANAIFNAIGRRIRQLPMTPEFVMVSAVLA